MKDFTEVLDYHSKKYRFAQPQDIVKLIYQSVFGGAHMITDEKSAVERLKSEYNSIKKSEMSHEGISNIESLGECVRFYIDKNFSERELTLLGRLFYISANKFPVGFDNADEFLKSQFIERLKYAKKLSSTEYFNFTEACFDKYLENYFSIGCPAVSHSEQYRNAYKPAYRIIDSRCARMYECICKLDSLLQNAKAAPIVAAIDGRAASGKTTSAEILSEFFEDSEIVHMDDFFLPNELRTRKRLTEAGGNLHRERFIDEVLSHIRDTDGFSYRIFDCSTCNYKPKPRIIPKAQMIICEGAYSLHPAFGDYSDIYIFSTITPVEQENRILNRNGDEMLKRFKSMWIPMEEKYFKAFDIEKRCDIII